MNITMDVDVEVRGFADSLTEDQAFETIKQIDLAQANWEFTHKMCKEFLKQMKVLILEDEVEGALYMNELKEILG